MNAVSFRRTRAIFHSQRYSARGVFVGYFPGGPSFSLSDMTWDLHDRDQDAGRLPSCISDAWALVVNDGRRRRRWTATMDNRKELGDRAPSRRRSATLLTLGLRRRGSASTGGRRVEYSIEAGMR